MQKVFIWGTGKNTEILLKNGLEAEILGYIETGKTQDRFCGKKVYSCTEIPEEYNALIVTSSHSNEIYRKALEQNLDTEKMIFMHPCAYVDPGKHLDWIGGVLGQSNFEIYCGTYGFYDRTFYARDKACYTRLNKRPAFAIDEKYVWPIIKDKFENAGTVNNYFWQDLWAARLICQTHPREHYDIGSRLDGFIAHILSAGIPVKMIDVRPFPVEIEGLETIIDDATEMRQFEDNSIESLSALCSLEHFGLGRYGDPVDPEACFKCFASIQKKLKRGGRLYISVPIGKERVEFNAHRIFYAKTIRECFSSMKLLEFSCATDQELEREISIEKYDGDMNCRGNRFGLFYFEKR